MALRRKSKKEGVLVTEGNPGDHTAQTHTNMDTHAMEQDMC